MASTAASRMPFSKVRAAIPEEWIWEALLASGTASIRRRRLPADQVIWLVLGIALERNRRIDEVVETLGIALPGSGAKGVSKGAIPQARQRLGAEPMKWLFENTGREWGLRSAERHQWRGLKVFGVDGSTLRVPDSVTNRQHFGSAGGGKRGLSAYPTVRIAALMALRSHLLIGASFGPYATSERDYAKDLWDLVPSASLVVVDRGFFGAANLIPLERTERHWLTRAKSNAAYVRVKRLGPGDDLVEMQVSKEARAADPTLPKAWHVRAIRYKRKGFREQVLLTSLLDPARWPKDEIIGLYHERWELELGYDELKTEMLERREAIRSKSPAMVKQELWGLLTVYNLVRLEMERAADEAGFTPTRMSFVLCLRLIRDEWRWASIARGPGALPKQLKRLRENLARLVLPERDPERRYPRAVKIKMSNYARKRTAATHPN